MQAPIVRLGLKVCKNGIRNHAALTRAPFRFRKIFLEERAERVTVRHPEKRECGAQHVHIESIDIGAEVTLLLSSFENAVENLNYALVQFLQCCRLGDVLAKINVLYANQARKIRIYLLVIEDELDHCRMASGGGSSSKFSSLSAARIRA